MKTAVRFWRKVDKDGPHSAICGSCCWQWTGAKTKGYGYIRGPEGKNLRAHRYSYALVNGPISPEIQVDHRCLNHSCVNPAHLRAATNKQNCEHRDGAHVDNTSGARGVSWHARTGKWQVRVMHNGKNVYGGVFLEIADANTAAIELRQRLFTFSDGR